MLSVMHLKFSKHAKMMLFLYLDKAQHPLTDESVNDQHPADFTAAGTTATAVETNNQHMDDFFGVSDNTAQFINSTNANNNQNAASNV